MRYRGIFYVKRDTKCIPSWYNRTNGDIRSKRVKKAKNGQPKKRVRLVREKVGVGQTTFGKNVHVSQSAIKKAEQYGQMGIDTAICIAKEYDVSLDYLYGLSDIENTQLEHIGRAFKAVFNAEEEEYILDAINEKLIFNAFKVQCSEDLLKYLTERRKLENDFNSAIGEEARKNIQEDIKSTDEKYIQRIASNNRKSTYILMTEELFEHCLDVIRTEKDPDIDIYKKSYNEAIEKIKKSSAEN